MIKLIANLCVVFLVSGCASSSLMKSSANVLTDPISAITGKKKSSDVSKILCLWEAAEGQGLDEKPTRGFAGQIMCFGYGGPSPIETNGIVRIYEYDDFDADDEDPQPIHTFVFDNGGWNAHRVDGTVGTTYNVFLPYVKKSKDHVVCALRVEFESPNGRKVSSPFTEVTLASKTSSRPARALQRDIVTQGKPEVRQASATRQQQLWKEDVQTKLESTTIQLPRKPRR